MCVGNNLCTFWHPFYAYPVFIHRSLMRMQIIKLPIIFHDFYNVMCFWYKAIFYISDIYLLRLMFLFTETVFWQYNLAKNEVKHELKFYVDRKWIDIHTCTHICTHNGPLLFDEHALCMKDFHSHKNSNNFVSEAFDIYNTWNNGLWGLYFLLSCMFYWKMANDAM